MGRKIRNKSKDLYYMQPHSKKNYKWSVTGDFIVDVVLFAGILDMIISLGLFYLAYSLLENFGEMESTMSMGAKMMGNVLQTVTLENKLEQLKMAKQMLELGLPLPPGTCSNPPLPPDAFALEMDTLVYYIGLLLRLFVVLVVFVSINFIASVLLLFIGIYKKHFMYCEIWIFFNRVCLVTCATLLICGCFMNFFELYAYKLVFSSYAFHRVSVEFGIRYFQRKTVEWNDPSELY